MFVHGALRWMQTRRRQIVNLAILALREFPINGEGFNQALPQSGQRSWKPLLSAQISTDLKLALICSSDEAFESQDFNLICVNEVRFQTTTHVEAS